MGCTPELSGLRPEDLEFLDDRISAIASLPKVFYCPFSRLNYNKRRIMTCEKCDISRIYYKFDKSLNG